MNGQRHKKTLSIIWSVSSHNSASSKGKLCCRQKNHQKAASLSAVLCAVQLNRLSSKSHCTYNKYRICCRVCDVTQQQTLEDRSSFIKGSVQTSYINNHTNSHSRLQLSLRKCGTDKLSLQATITTTHTTKMWNRSNINFSWKQLPTTHNPISHKRETN